ncbi:hypothetical protein NPIL_205511 [Nephila pilipes]|uniref:Uncharacterized protein n=1 Tax=Nephila pilipes TaxID=299642 RepID=A0A8X6I3R7_NEPPI|nr:hypothetical protein NPIL_205511 [Nephila pilipes]
MFGSCSVISPPRPNLCKHFNKYQRNTLYFLFVNPKQILKLSSTPSGGKSRLLCSTPLSRLPIGRLRDSAGCRRLLGWVKRQVLIARRESLEVLLGVRGKHRRGFPDCCRRSFQR